MSSSAQDQGHLQNPVLEMMSADDKEGVATRSMENGAAFFMVKPLQADDIRNIWQFAASNQPTHEVGESQKASGEIPVSGSSVNEDRQGKKPAEVTIKRSPNGNGEGNSRAAQKKGKVIWTNALHNRFLQAIQLLGFHRAVPKRILEVMNVPGLTRENVASHLQKYRIFLKRVSEASYKVQHTTTNDNLMINRPSTTLFQSPSSISSMLRLNSNHQLENPLYPSVVKNTLSSNYSSFPYQETSNRSRSLSRTPSLWTSNAGNTTPGIEQTSYHQMNPSFQVFLSSYPSQNAPPPEGLITTTGLSRFNAPSLNKIPAYRNIGTSIISSAPTNFSSTPTNFRSTDDYAGYKISDIGLTAGSMAVGDPGQGGNHSKPVDNLSNSTGKFHSRNNKNSDMLAQDMISWSSLLDDMNGGKQLPSMLFSDEIQETSALLLPSYECPTMLNSVENGRKTTFPTQVNIEPPVLPKSLDVQQNGDDQTIMNSDFSASMNLWQGSLPVASFRQTASQNQSGGSSLIDSQQGGTSTEPSNTFLYAEELDDDAEFVESLLAFGPFGDDGNPAAEF